MQKTATVPDGIAFSTHNTVFSDLRFRVPACRQFWSGDVCISLSVYLLLHIGYVSPCV